MVRAAATSVAILALLLASSAPAQATFSYGGFGVWGNLVNSWFPGQRLQFFFQQPEVTVAPVTVPTTITPVSQTGCTTPAAAAQSTPELATLVRLAEATGLVTALSDTSAVATIFAPTNDAFARLLGQLSITQDQLLANTTLVRNVLLTHVVPGAAVRSNQLTEGQVINTASGATVTARLNPVRIISKNPNPAVVTKADVEACASIVHIVDNVLLP